MGNNKHTCAHCGKEIVGGGYYIVPFDRPAMVNVPVCKGSAECRSAVERGWTHSRLLRYASDGTPDSELAANATFKTSESIPKSE